jgi:hypothetical protein
MKQLILIIFMMAVNSESGYCQNPTYILKATNITRTSPNEYTFEIRMQHTNSPVYFEYAGGRCFFDFNKEIANGGSLSLSFAPDSSDLPLNMRPRNPTVYTSSTPGQLRVAPNTFPGAGYGFVGISTSSPGTKIIKLRLRTTAFEFADVSLNLTWRNTWNPDTKIYAYLGPTITDITNGNWHSIDSTVSSAQTIMKFGIEGLILNETHRIRDSVTIQFRSVVSPFSVIYNSVHVLDSATLTTTVSSYVPAGIYYIVVRSKNSLETWSKPGGEPLGNGNYFYDFTSSASQAYGNNLVLKDGLYCIYSGNVNGDDVIDAEDLLAVDNAVFNYAPGTSIANLNGDNIVDIEDMAICDNNARAIRVVERPGSLESIRANEKIIVP